METRSSGILMHISSLPSPYGIGSLGKEAREFADFLKASGQKYWQVLPLGHTGFGDSPYQCFSAAAGNPLLIDLPTLEAEGLLTKEELAQAVYIGSPDYVDYDFVTEKRNWLFHRAYDRVDDQVLEQELTAFAQENQSWLPDYALFMAIKERFEGRPLWLWEDEDIRQHKPEAVMTYRNVLNREMGYYIFVQYLFFKQWERLKTYVNSLGISIIGDLPIYVSADSSDVWSHPKLFQLDDRLFQKMQAGVPPDYYSATGQLWGNPVYDWDYHEKTGYAWWIWRMEQTRRLFDVIRIDHFRGFSAYWAVPAGEETAIGGQWYPGPGKKLFDAMENALGKVPIIAEDLGEMDDGVRQLLADCGYPGMKVMIFGFDAHNDSEHLPHSYPENCVGYTSTHDAQTICEQIMDIATAEEQQFVYAYLRSTPQEPLGWSAIQSLFASHAKLAMVAMQDVLSLGKDARMNIPSTVGGNWRWRVRREALNGDVAQALKRMTLTYKRNLPQPPKKKAVLWDLDGTILNTLADLTGSVNAVLARHGQPTVTEEIVRQRIGNGIGQLIRKSMPEGTSEEERTDCLQDFLRHYDAHCLEQTQPYEGMEALFRHLKEYGLKLAVLSNKKDELTDKICRHYYGSLLDTAVGEREGIPRKPNPAGLLKLLEELGVSPAEAVYIGDSPGDAKAAQAAGVDFIGVLWGYRSRRQLEEAGRYPLAESVTELGWMIEEA